MMLCGYQLAESVASRQSINQSINQSILFLKLKAQSNIIPTRKKIMKAFFSFAFGFSPVPDLQAGSV